MPSFDIKKYRSELIALGVFLIVTFMYCYPQLQGKKLVQGDTMNWRATAQEGMEWHKKTGENVMWSNNMFGGMPTYTHYVPESNNYIWKIQIAIVDLLGRPAAFLFMAMVCFFILMRALKVNQWLAIAGALAYAFSAYNVEIIDAGHETKMYSIAYFPAVLAGLLYLYNSDWWKGILTLGISLSLMVANSHYQMVFYALIVVLFAVIGQFIIAIKNNGLKNFFIASLVAAALAVLAVGPNMQFILATMEYNKETMRGGTSELTLNQHDANKKSGGLDKEYAFRWSNGVGETFSLMIPFLYGGGSTESVEHAPATEERFGAQVSRVPLYWGPQRLGISGPIYFGAIVCFLFVLGIMLLKGPNKWWMLAVSILSIMMSWGDHFPGFNYFLFDNVPLLNKFRTPTMVLTIAELIFPVVAMLGVQQIINQSVSKEEILKKLKIAAGVTIGLSLLLGVGGSMFFDFAGPNDGEMQKEFVNALRVDRADVAMKSGFTSALYILLAAGLIWAFVTDKIKSAMPVMLGLAALITIDLIVVDSRYLNEESYVDETDYDNYFQPRPVDEQILQDKDPYYRVLDLTTDPFNDAKPTYYHKLIGGYSPVKMERYQDLIDIHMRNGFNSAVMNMLNTKYIIFNGQGNQPSVMRNPGACGNAWFVSDVKWANTADEEILALNAPKLGDTATVENAFDPLKTAVIRNTFKNDMGNYIFGKDSAAKVSLAKYGLNNISYESSNSQNGLAVFSDIYYAQGWKAYIDGKETPILKADYVLRAVKIPAGNHKIEFKFHPDTFYKGDRIAMISSILLLLTFAISLAQLFRKKQEPVV